MSQVVLRGATWALRGMLLVAVIALTMAAFATRLGPVFGHEVLVIRGASMAPTLPLGTAIVVSRTPPQDVGAGDIVSFRGTNGVIITHRVVESIVQDGGRLYRTEGDANGTSDPSLVPDHALLGVVRAQVPYVGYLLAMMAHPFGLVSLVTGFIACSLALSMLDQRQPRVRRSKRGLVLHDTRA